MLRRVLLVAIVLLLGVRWVVPGPPLPLDGWSLHLNGPMLAVLVYAVLTVLAWISTLNHLPGVFALRRPLGTLASGYEYLWGAAILAALVSFEITYPIESRIEVLEAGRVALEDAGTDWAYGTLAYGGGQESYWPAAALGTFALLMLTLKLRASMIEANRFLPRGDA